MNTVVMMGFGSDAWNAELYNSLSLTSHIAAAIKDRAAALTLAVNLRRLVSKLDSILGNARSMIEGKTPLPVSDEPSTPQKAHNGVDTIQMISRVLSYTYESASRRRLTNNSLLASPLRRVNQLAEEFADIADWLETALQSEEIDSVFLRAAQEREHGDIYNLDLVE